MYACVCERMGDDTRVSALWLLLQSLAIHPPPPHTVTHRAVSEGEEEEEKDKGGISREPPRRWIGDVPATPMRWEETRSRRKRRPAP